MEHILLSRFAPSPFSRLASPFGKGDAARAAGRPLHGCHGFDRDAPAQQPMMGSGAIE